MQLSWTSLKFSHVSTPYCLGREAIVWDEKYVPDNRFLRQHNQPTPRILHDGVDMVEVDALVNRRIRGTRYHYLVKYRGYGPEHNQWAQAHHSGISFRILPDGVWREFSGILPDWIKKSMVNPWFMAKTVKSQRSTTKNGRNFGNFTWPCPGMFWECVKRILPDFKKNDGPRPSRYHWSSVTNHLRYWLSYQKFI